MTPVALTLYVAIAVAGLAAFASFLLLGTRYASPRSLGFCLLAFGSALSAAMLRDLGRLAVIGREATGVVEVVVWHNKAAHPVVRFTTTDGQEVQFRCRQGVSRGVYEPGQSVPVLYLQSDPEFAVVATGRSLGGSLAGGAAFCGVVLASGLALMVWRPRSKLSSH